jgi:hypothetical protein
MGEKKNNVQISNGQYGGRASPQRLFTDRIERLLVTSASWAISGEDELLRRLCSDNRMDEAWKLLATFGDDQFEGFIQEMLDTVLGVHTYPRLQELHRERRERIIAACETTKQFIEMCERPLFVTPLQAIMGTGPEDDRASLKDCFPELVAKAQEALLVLMAEKGVAKEDEVDDVGGLSRKFGDGRTEIARELASLIRYNTDKPNYGAVAALLNVILDTGDEDDIGPDAVRKAVSRGPDHSAK